MPRQSAAIGQARGQGKMQGKMQGKLQEKRAGKLRRRSQYWFDNPGNPGMTALYVERYLNYGLTPE